MSKLKIFAVFAALCLLSPLRADEQKLDPRKEAYISQYSAMAVSEMRRTGVPASITLAQGLLESGAGRSTLAVKGNNHFGIKCHKNWTGKSMKHDDDAPQECFRVYDRAEDSYRDHSDFLRGGDRYKFLFDYRTTDYKSWAFGLKKAGYATDPQYAYKLIDLIELYHLNRYDRGIVEVEPPHQIETPKVVRRQRDAREETLEFESVRSIYSINGVHFVYAQQGETYASIAREYNLFTSEVLKFNDVKKGCEPLPGEIVYLKAKKSKAAKGQDVYVTAEPEEDIHAIAQRFAVKEKSVRKRNGFGPDYVLAEGQEIKLR